MAIQLVDLKTGQPTEVRDDEVHAAVASGSFGFTPGTEVPVQDPDSGETFNIPAENATTAFKGGYRLATPQAISATGEKAVEARQQEFLNAPESQVAAFGTGLAGGVTFGLSDVALRGISPESAKLVGEVQKANPISTMAGQAVGMLAPTGAGGLIATAGRAGEQAAARAASKLIPRLAEGIVGRSANKALGSAIEGSLMSGGMAVTEAALGDPSEVAENLAGNLVTGALFGGAIGGGATLAAPALRKFADLVGRGAKAVTEGVEGFVKNRVFDLQGEGGALARELDKSSTYKRAKELVSQEAEFSKAADKTLNQIVKEGKVAETQSKAILESVVTDNKRAIEAATKGNLDDLIRAEQDIDNFGNNIVNKRFEDGINAVGDVPAKGVSRNTLSSIDEAAAKLEGMVDSPEKRKALEQLSKIKQGMQPDVLQSGLDTGSLPLNTDVLSSYGARQQVGDLAFKRLPRGEARDVLTGLYNNIKSHIDQVDEVRGLFQESDAFWKNRYDFSRQAQQNLQEKVGGRFQPSINKALARLTGKHEVAEDAVMNTLANMSEFMPELSKVVDDFIVNRTARQANIAAQDVAKQALLKLRTGEGTMDDIVNLIKEQGGSDKIVQQAKKMGESNLIASLRAASPSATDADILLQFNRKVGLPVTKELEEIVAHQGDIEKILRLRKMAAGAERPMVDIPTAVGTGVGGLIGGGLGAAIGAGVGKVSTAMSNPLRMIDTFKAIEQAGAHVKKAYDIATDTAIRGFTSKPVAKATTIAATTSSVSERREQYKKYQQSVAEAGDNLKRLQGNIQAQIAPHAPQIAQALQAQINTTQQFLMSKIPQDPTTQSSFLPSKSKYVPSDAELSKMNRYIKAVSDPTSVIENIGKGTVSPEEIETLKATNPIQFKQLQSSILSAIMEQQSDLSYKQRLTLGNLFEIPSDPSLTPGFFTEMQQNFVQQNNGQQGGRPPVVKVNAKKMSSAIMPMSENERVKYK